VFAGQGGFQVLAVVDAAAGQDPVRVLAGADPLDGQQVTVGGDQQTADTIVMALLDGFRWRGRCPLLW
jgi:hypothetical protein